MEYLEKANEESEQANDELEEKSSNEAKMQER